jgi:hypothetical protein
MTDTSLLPILEHVYPNPWLPSIVALLFGCGLSALFYVLGAAGTNPDALASPQWPQTRVGRGLLTVITLCGGLASMGVQRMLYRDKLSVLAALVADPTGVQAAVATPPEFTLSNDVWIALRRPRTVIAVDTLHAGAFVAMDTTWAPALYGEMPLVSLRALVAALDTSSLASAAQTRAQLAALTTPGHATGGPAR